MTISLCIVFLAASINDNMPSSWKQRHTHRYHQINTTDSDSHHHTATINNKTKVVSGVGCERGVVYFRELLFKFK